MNLSADFPLNGNGTVKIDPLVLVMRQGDYFSAGAGTSVESSHLAVNAVAFADNGNNVNIQTGFAFKFSSVSVYYNYQFNAITGNSMLPLSLLHPVGLAFSLIIVEKRKAFKTINFPKL